MAVTQVHTEYTNKLAGCHYYLNLLLVYGKFISDFEVAPIPRSRSAVRTIAGKRGQATSGI